MNGDTAIANILRMEGTEHLFCYPANSLIEAAADGRDSTHNVPHRADDGEHGRRLHPHHQRAPHRRSRDPVGAGNRKRLRRRGSRLRRIDSGPGAARRHRNPAARAVSGLRCGLCLPGGHQVGRPDQSGRAHPGDDAARLHLPAIRQGQPGHGASAAGHRAGGVGRGRLQLPSG